MRSASQSTRRSACKRTGERKTIFFTLSGHGHFDMAAYDSYPERPSSKIARIPTKRSRWRSRSCPSSPIRHRERRGFGASGCAEGSDGRMPRQALAKERGMIKPYTAVGLIPTVRGIRKREDIARQPRAPAPSVKAAAWLSSLDLPVRLIALPEGALQGFNDEVLDLDHVQFARECAIDIPGPETDALGVARARVQCLHHGAGQGASSRLEGSLLQRRLHPRSQGRDHPAALQGLAAVSGRAFGLPARHLRLVGGEVRPARSTPSGRWWTPRSAASAS